MRSKREKRVEKIESAKGNAKERRSTRVKEKEEELAEYTHFSKGNKVIIKNCHFMYKKSF